MKSKAKRIFAVTTGDPDGIGVEVTSKALGKLKSPRATEFVVFATSYKSSRWLNPLRKMKRVSVVLRDDTPADWVRVAAEGCLNGDFAGMVTGPMSKNPTGHTEILSKTAGRPLGLMCFLGSKCHVILATGHIPLSQVSTSLTEERLEFTFEQALLLRKRLRIKKPIGVLGLNPHAGESGQIGHEEEWIRALVSRQHPKNIKGPLVPDAAFTSGQLNKFGMFIALYHDQGLIPFKALHGFDEGAHLTLGLPFVRTSVDHGTAKDIFNRGRAHFGSMLSALEWAGRLV